MHSAKGDAPTASVPDRLRVNSFGAVAHPIGPEDRALLHELTVGVFWSHRSRDLDLLIALGEGYLATDEIGRAMGSSMYYPAGSDFAMLGMMITAPRLQTLGTGRWLMRRVMADCTGRDLRLSATRSGYRLYESEGFVPLRTIWQHQGIARPIHTPDAVPGVSLRGLLRQDEAAVRTLDSGAFGATRTQVLDALLPISSGMVIERGGELIGFALAREFGRGVVIGPMLAEDAETAMMLTAPFIQRNEGAFVRLDTPVDSDKFGGFLAAAGLGVYDTVTEMYFGTQRRRLEGTQIFALAAQSLG
jgi:GNAT superfamily N-acetyltransferase